MAYVPPSASLWLLAPISLIQQRLLRRQYRDLAQHFSDLLQRAPEIRDGFDVLAQDSEEPAEDFAVFDLAEGLD
jgi:hypothetical protein